jgi:hypothetical protein
MTTVQRWRSAQARVALFGVAVGAVYGILAMTIGVGAIAWLLVLIVLSWRLSVRDLSFPAVGFVVGFAIAFLGLLVPSNLSCQPPSCFATPWDVDLTWAGVDLFVAAVLVSLARLGRLFVGLGRPRL